ncbi:MAG: VPLPA-CTERM sorting domain-containing protein [Pseudomonadota bacterium]
MKRLLMAAGLALATLSLAPASASTIPIVGGATAITVTADLGALSIAAAPTGSASLDVIDGDAVFSFPITGGEVASDGEALIEHGGSGVSLVRAGTTTEIGDFLIDTAGGIVSGSFNGGGSTTLFSFGTVGADGVELLISPFLAGALANPGLIGAQFGFASPAPETPPVAAVPLPASAWMLLAAVGAVGVIARRRARAA